MKNRSETRLSSHLLILAVLLALPAAAHSAGAAELDSSGNTDRYTITRHLDGELLKRHQNFGYTEEEIRKYFNYPQQFDYDTTGMAKGLIKAPPAPGTHPRVFFNPEDLPALRIKLSGSRPGKAQMDAIRKTLQDLITGPKAKYGKLYQDAANGVGGREIIEVEPACAIEYEAFRCLIDNDQTGAKKVSAALATLASVESTALDDDFAKEDQQNSKNPGKSTANANLAPGEKPFRDYQRTKTITQAGMLGLAYDFTYNWMTDVQRNTVRATIAKASANMTAIGDEGLPAFPATTSNWIPMHMRLILLTLSIEGERGYDPTTIERCAAGYRNYLSAGFFPAGEMYESMGKNFVCTENLVPIANRGDNLVALKQLRSQVDNYYLAAMDPWGGHFTFYDSLGGRGNTTPMFDVMVLKHYFPKDPAIDFVYRNTVGENYETFGKSVHFGHPFHLNDGVIQAIFGEEFDGTKSWDEALAAATAGKPLTYFSVDTGNMITRSAWTRDAVQLHFLTRCVAGGHQYCDRTHFSLHALGRYWGIYKPLRQVDEHYLPKNRSVILIDGKGPGMATSRCADMQDQPEATFIAADAKTAYNYTTGGNNRFPKGGQPAPFTGNDFRLTKSVKPWMDMPWSDLPNWQTSMKGSELWLPFNTVKRAYRTAGLVRGKHCYALIVDDFQQDEASHDYQWGMILEDDLAVDSVVTDSTAGSLRNDVILSAPEDTEGRHLLVRILNADGLVDPKTPASIDNYEIPNPPQNNIALKRLEITSHSVSPNFKVLLFPYRKGEDLPKTTWSRDRETVAVEWPDQTDMIRFTQGKDGRTRMVISRGNTILADLK
jgi:hypothetical protein